MTSAGTFPWVRQALLRRRHRLIGAERLTGGRASEAAPCGCCLHRGPVTIGAGQLQTTGETPIYDSLETALRERGDDADPVVSGTT